MCGIAGFFGKKTTPLKKINAMLGALIKRGPDAQHYKSWNNQWQVEDNNPCNALLHTRLSIRDPSHNADQPMSNAESDVWICYNGEVYGWENDAARLKEQGFIFRSSSDTEFILHAYQAWGLGFIDKLRGMFAIVILDLRTQRLYALRDRMGIKPLVYHHDRENFAFGSTVRSVLPYLTKDERDFSPEGIDAFLAHRYIPAPRTIFKNIQRLENGHYLSLNLINNHLEKVCYWQPKPKNGKQASMLLKEAIGIRTVSDRPVGLFLSGGVDSTCLASQLKENKFNDFSAFTARFDDQQFDESLIAKETAQAFDIKHQTIDIPKSLTINNFDEIVADLDEPFADPSCFPMWHLAKDTAESVTVVLGGDGGDELFSGYKRYAKHLRSAWRQKIRLPGSAFSGTNKIVSEIRSTWLDAYNLRFSGFTPQQRRELQNNQTLKQVTYWRDGKDDLAYTAQEQLLNCDMQNYLPEYILRKGDLCTMAHGLELRCPIIDHHFYEAILDLNHHERFTKPSKLWFKPSLGKRANILSMKKRGFNPPLNHWLQCCWNRRYKELGKRLNTLSQGQISSETCDALIFRYQNGETHLAEKVLQLLMLDSSLSQLSALP